MLEITTLEQVSLNIQFILLHLSCYLIISSSKWMVISATSGFDMVLIVYMAHWPSQELQLCISSLPFRATLLQELMIYNELPHTIFWCF
jgi:hypothetical protein